MGIDIELFRVPKDMCLDKFSQAFNRGKEPKRCGYLRYNGNYMGFMREEFAPFVIYAIDKYEQKNMFDTTIYPNIEPALYKTCRSGLDWILGLVEDWNVVHYPISHSHLDLSIRRINFLKIFFKSPLNNFKALHDWNQDSIGYEIQRIKKDFLIFTPNPDKQYIVSWG